MKKSELIKRIAGLTGETQVTVKNVLASLDNLLVNNAAAGEETQVGLLTVTTVGKAARTARNPITGAAVAVPAKNGIKVKVGKALKDAANYVAS